MTTAIQTIILAVEKLIACVGDTDGTLAAAVADLKAQEAAEQIEIDDLTKRVAALEVAPVTSLQPLEEALAAVDDRVKTLEGAEVAPTAPVDLTSITDRVQALEDRNAEDDAAADDLAPKNAAGAPVDPMIAVTLSPDALPDPVLGQPYTALITPEGGSAPYAFSIASGSLPDGLTLSSGGAITGTPVAAGQFPVTIQAHDNNGTVAVISYPMSVAEPVAAPVDEPELNPGV